MSNPFVQFSQMFEQITKMSVKEVIDRQLNGESEQSIVNDISNRIKEETRPKHQCKTLEDINRCPICSIG